MSLLLAKEIVLRVAVDNARATIATPLVPQAMKAIPRSLESVR